MKTREIIPISMQTDREATLLNTIMSMDRNYDAYGGTGEPWSEVLDLQASQVYQCAT